uniref:Uncharacterized protein LOC114339272 n=1 Tax=Diabrotica virgifera virgifera TaxID=50390 RepID=A0A6P7GPK2_DIAVI
MERTFNDPSTKILGLQWNSTHDLLHIKTGNLFNTSPLTKRKILSVIASAFDPLGTVNILTVFGKLLMQSVRKSQIGWDVHISDISIITQFEKFLASLAEISQLHVPRQLTQSKVVSSCSLHRYCDASQKAYGGCIYLVAIYSDGSKSPRLISAKSRVNPIKTKLTLSKLELWSTLARRIFQLLSISIQIHSVHLWSDSQVALSWVKRSPDDFSPFIARRVLTIHENSKEFAWRYVKSHLNSDDLLSRGIFSSDTWLSWIEGPQFLVDQTEFGSLDSFKLIDDLPERKKVNLALVNSDFNIWDNVFSRFSDFNTLQRVLAQIFRFTMLVRKKSNNPLICGKSQNCP